MQSAFATKASRDQNRIPNSQTSAARFFVPEWCQGDVLIPEGHLPSCLALRNK